MRPFADLSRTSPDEAMPYRRKRPTPTLEDYWASLPEDRRADLTVMREMVLRIWTDAQEDMACNMPTYHLDGEPFCALANQKHFMALYIMPYDLLDAFRNDLIVQDHGRSCIRFKRLTPQLLDLFDRVLKYTGTRLPESVHFGKGSNVHTYLRH
jgi:uncharacterized protein YdhG (YjbR/CyaY superfamily)